MVNKTLHFRDSLSDVCIWANVENRYVHLAILKVLVAPSKGIADMDDLINLTTWQPQHATCMCVVHVCVVAYS